jgi:hypothetical protein
MFLPERGLANIEKLPELVFSRHRMVLTLIPLILIHDPAFHLQVTLQHSHYHLPETGLVNIAPQKKRKSNLLVDVLSFCPKLSTMEVISRQHLPAL